MKTSNIIKSAVLTTYLLASQSFASVIVDNDWYTTDTNTNLDWLDITLTVGQSYDTITTNTAINSTHAPNGWINAGWRYASTLELKALLFNLDPNYCDCGYSPLNNAVVQQFIALLGDVIPFYSTNNDVAQSYGMTADLFNNVPGQYNVSFLHHRKNRNDGDDFINTSYQGLDHSLNQPYIGHFLVRNSTNVPEPMTIITLGISILGLMLMKSKDKVKVNAL